MANKKSDPNSIKSGDQIAKDEFIEDLDEEELKEIKGGINYRSVTNDTLFGGGRDSAKIGNSLNTIYGGSGNDTLAPGADIISGFDKLKR